MKNFIKEILRENESMLKIAAVIYNIYHLNYPFIGSFSGVFLKNTKFKLTGNNITIKCGAKSRLINCTFYIKGSNSTIQIGDKCLLQNVELIIEDDNGCINIGKNTTMSGGNIAVTEGGLIEIGEDCMFSGNVQIRNGDSHSIFDLTLKNRINFAKPIQIGNHVWLAFNTTILKGAAIADNSIIANGAIVNSKCLDRNAIYAGIPAKKVKDCIYWERER